MSHEYSFNKKELFNRSNVVGYGQGYKEVGGVLTSERALIVMVSKKLPAEDLMPDDLVPLEIGGLPTDVMETGIFTAFQKPTEKHRPAPGGVSIGHFGITAGTFGSVVRDASTGTRLILSNNHVLANSNNASIGDEIYQPGVFDGGSSSDQIAELYKYVSINFGGDPVSSVLAETLASLGNLILGLFGEGGCRLDVECSEVINLVDAALARPLKDSDVSNDILGIGPVSGYMPAYLGQSVRKSGRTTGLTTGSIAVIDAVVNVSYGQGKSALFEEQIVSGYMSDPGDSGSLLVAGEENVAVGLLFAGSDTSTVYGTMANVVNLLDVTI